MIGRLAGVIVHRAMDQVMIDVRGVGYIVHVSERTAAALPPVGQACALYTDLLVREDLLQLFGFPSLLEKEWHRLLTGVQGIGAKAALAILGTLGAEGLGRAIALGDWSAVRRAPGVGPKLAQRVVLELKDKAPAIMALGGALTVAAPDGADLAAADLVTGDDAAPPPPPGAAAPRAPAGAKRAAQASTQTAAQASAQAAAQAAAQATSDALSALANLGYAPAEAAAAVAEAASETPGAGMQALIRAALKALAPKG